MKIKNIVAISLLVLLFFGIWKFRSWREAEVVKSYGGIELPDVSDKRTQVQRLEDRVKKLEASLKAQSDLNDGILKSLNLMNGYITNNTELGMVIALQFAEHVANTNIHRPLAPVGYYANPYAATAQPRVATPQPRSKAGVPENIYNQIASAAAKDHPGDYSTQEYVIRRQIEAYQKLSR